MKGTGVKTPRMARKSGTKGSPKTTRKGGKSTTKKNSNKQY